MKKIILLSLFALTGQKVFAQDPQFSQYYAAPLYLNPAFSGTADHHRFITNYRNQWPGAGNGFATYALSYDNNLIHLNSGLGVMVVTDKAGTANLRSTTFNFQYSYKVNIYGKWMLSSGLNFGLGSRSIDFSKLVFGDQLQDGRNTTSDQVLSNIQSTNYFDFGAGVLAYNKSFWFGFSSMHLNNPNRSLIDQAAHIPVKTSLHGGVRIPLYRGVFKRDKIAAIAPSFVYKNQGRFDQLDLGTYFLYEPIVVGLWYRGIPITQDTEDNVSQDAVVVVLGFQLTRFELSYSYDLTVSKLGPASGGAHEIALKYHLNIVNPVRTKKRERFIPCPTFNR